MMFSFPWDALAVEMGEDGFPIYDRAYSASDLREVYSAFFSNGVFINQQQSLAVTAGSNMSVQVGTGKCCINGTIGYNNEAETFMIEAADAQPRIDTVVLRWDASTSTRDIVIDVVKGTPSASPVRPNLKRTRTVYELGLCDVLIKTGSTKVEQQNIVDTRLDSSRCGIVTPFIEIDVTSFYHRMDAAIEEGIRRHQLQADVEMKKLTIAVDNALELADKLTSGTGEGCGCYEEMQLIKKLLYELLGGQEDSKYYVIGKTLYIPPDRGLYADDTITFTTGATVSGTKLTLV